MSFLFLVAFFLFMSFLSIVIDFPVSKKIYNASKILDFPISFFPTNAVRDSKSILVGDSYPLKLSRYNDFIRILKFK